IGQGTLSANANYAIAYTGANFTIAPAPLRVAADSKSKVYGDADPGLTYTTSGFKFGDTEASVLTGQLARVTGETVASRPYVIGRGPLHANANYAIVYTGAALDIAPRPITLAADNQSKIELAPDPMFTARLVGGNVVFGDAASGTLTRVAGDRPGT